MSTEKATKASAVDCGFYERLCVVVREGKFKDISFSPWHKGCDTELDATCDWPDLKDLMEDWYYKMQGDIEPHTHAIVSPEFSEGNLIFGVFTQWDHCADGLSNDDKAWDEEGFQRMVHDHLPKKFRDKTDAADLLVSLEITYDEPGKCYMSNFSVSSMDCRLDENLSASISPDAQQVIKNNVVEWCLRYFNPDGDFSASVMENGLSSFNTYASEKFLITPAKKSGDARGLD